MIPPRREKIAEGKTKIIWVIPGTHEVLIESRDDITAGDEGWVTLEVVK